MADHHRLRPAAVAGAFYPGSAEKMDEYLRRYMPPSDTPVHALGAISPHAGWPYSGDVAGKLFASITVPDTVILIGPNHRGLGEKASLDEHDGWEFPFGTVPLNREAAEEMAVACRRLAFDSRSHMMEHSLEVIVPFLHARNPEVRIVPVALFTEDEETALCVGEAAAKAAEKHNALIVASSDMTHFLDDKTARAIDRETIETIKRMDPHEVLTRAKREQALCGGAPVAAMLHACRMNGAKTAAFTGYANSGDATGDTGSVVGYCGFAVR